MTLTISTIEISLVDVVLGPQVVSQVHDCLEDRSANVTLLRRLGLSPAASVFPRALAPSAATARVHESVVATRAGEGAEHLSAGEALPCAAATVGQADGAVVATALRRRRDP